MDPLIILAAIVSALLVLAGIIIGMKYSDILWQRDRVPLIREDAIKKSRSVLGGQFSEQLAPYLPGFNYPPTEARFLGKPIDFVIFKGMDAKEIEEIVFLEVKTGKAGLNHAERTLKNCIERKNVRWEELRIDLKKE
ncbi:MAG: Holliday junction resolvase-like protein [Candidatus Micrarchaeia archaeon]